MPINTVIHTNQHSVDRVLNAGAPVVLVFWSRKIHTSTQMDPMLDALAADFAGKALIAKIDAAEEPALVVRFNVTAVPTLLFFKAGKLVATAPGAADKNALAAWLTYLTGGGVKPALPSGPSVSLNGQSAPTKTYTNGSPGHGADAPRRGADAPKRAGGDGKPVTLTDANFAQVTGQSGPVLVDFWAAWCGPCRMVAPAVEQLAQEFAGRAVVGKLNVDENPLTAQQYRIMSIPALYIFKNGQVVEQLVGAQPAHALRQALQKHL